MSASPRFLDLRSAGPRTDTSPHARATTARRRLTARVDRLPVHVVGRLLVILAFVCSGLGSVLAKITFDLGTAPISFLFIRLIAAVFVLRILTRRDMWRVPLHRQQHLVGAGVLFGCQSLAYFSAVAISPVALVVVTVSSYPVAVLVLDSISSRTVPKPTRLAGMAASLVGLWLAAGRPDATPDLGLLLALASSVGFAVYLRVSASTLAPKQRRTDACDLAIPPMVATLWVLIGALGLVTAAMLVTGSGLPTPTATGLSILHGLGATTLPLVATYAALSRIRADDIAGLGPLEPIVATGVAVIALGEHLDLVQIIGIAVVIVAVAHMAGAIRSGRFGRPERPRVGLPRLPLAVVRQARPERRRRHVKVASQADIARLWGQPQS